MSDLSIVLVTYNSADWIERCLASLPAAVGGREARVIVVDNASTDDSARRAERPGVEVIVNERNVGFAAAVNQGARLAGSDWLLLLNPDTEARPRSLDALLTFAEAHPGHGVYGGRTLRSDGTVEPSSCWGLPTLWSTTCFALGLSTVFRGSRIFDPEAIGSWQRDSVRQVGMVSGCLLLVDRRTWARLGGFDERYYVYGEDADLNARARALGLRPIITPDSEVVHAIGASSGEIGNRMPLLLAGKLTYLRTHLPRAQRTLAVCLFRAGVGIRALAFRLTGRGGRWGVAWRRRHEWWAGFPSPAVDPRAHDPESPEGAVL
ncbi:MAG: glycosyltransferase family 2 protein [Actinomycetota bacterium]|nr:glycosyltransferase family 2 protein [Actinomycetota bacterium]